MTDYDPQGDIERWREAAVTHGGWSICAQLCSDCVTFYRYLLRQLLEEESVQSPTLIRLTRNFETLVLWADNYGVTHGELDWVLESSRRVRRYYIKAMNGICTTLLDRLLPLYPTIDMGETCAFLRSTIDDAADCLEESYQDDESRSSTSVASWGSQEDRIDEIIADLEVDMECLRDMGPLFTSPMAEKPAIAGTRTWVPYQYICDSIANMFPEAEENVIERVGKAAWDSILWCRNLTEGYSTIDSESLGAVARTIIARSAIARTKRTKDSALGSSIAITSGLASHARIGNNTVPVEGSPQEGFDVDLTQDSFAQLRDDTIQIPPLSQAAEDGNTFECNACGKMVVFTTMNTWRTHLLTDLHPYVCPLEPCIPETLPFANRREFYAHIRIGHAIHSENDHGLACPFCHEQMNHSLVDTTVHLSQHLEEISLNTLALRTDGDSAHDSETPAERFASSETPLAIAPLSVNAIYEKAKQALAAGADIEGRDEAGRTLLSRAAGQREGRATLELLLEAGADRETKDIQGRTPLMFAAAIHEYASVELLVEKGANIATTDNDGRTALDWAREPDKKAESFREDSQVIEFLERVYLQPPKLIQLDIKESQAIEGASPTHDDPPTFLPDILDEFRRKLDSEKEWKRTNHKKQIFYLPGAIVNWMAARQPQNGQPQNAALLLDVVYRGRGFPDITVSQIFSEETKETKCIIVFAILVSLGYGHLISVFHRHNVTDTRIDHDIDIQNSDLSRDLRKEGADAIKVLSEFEIQKWAFTPVPLTYLMHPSLSGSKWILPFTKYILIAEGGTARVYQVLVEGCLLSTEFRQLVREANDKVVSPAGFYEFAIKEYGHEHEDAFRRELRAFMAIRGQMGMVQCLGYFEHNKRLGDALGSGTTYNILLEFGEFDLTEFFADPQTYPPVLPQEILLFWRKFFKVADAISCVHELTHTTEGGTTSKYNGWHADIKPENILRVYGEFKLADFGYAKFSNFSEQVKRPLSFIDGGTAAYGAPEMDKRRRARGTTTPLTQAIDVWSFACVLSITATWAILGLQGVLQYEQVRKRAIEDIVDDQKPVSHRAFHNGNSVLLEVKEWHKLLRSSMRKTDPITDQILDIIDNEMLLNDPHKRIHMRDLCRRLAALMEQVEHALKVSDMPQPPQVMDTSNFERTTQPVPLTLSLSRRQTHRFQWRIPMYRMRWDVVEDYLRRRFPNESFEEAQVDNFWIIDAPRKQTMEDVIDINGLIRDDYVRSRTGVKPCPLYSPYQNYEKEVESFAMFRERLKLENKMRKHKFWLKQEKDADLKNIIEDRDIMFVVDRSSTMRPCWSWATFWVETLAMKLARLDDDGLDLVFTGNGDLDHMGCKRPAEFKTRMDKVAPELDPMATDMAGCLSKIFRSYRKNRRYATKALTLIIVTDGRWSLSSGTERGNKVEETIVDFVKDLMSGSKDVKDKLKHRWFSTQFISFATDGRAHANLKDLDSAMWRRRDIPDVIDTKPWDHNRVQNLILGSFHEGADDSDEDDPIAVTSSTST